MSAFEGQRRKYLSPEEISSGQCQLSVTGQRENFFWEGREAPSTLFNGCQCKGPSTSSEEYLL